LLLQQLFVPVEKLRNPAPKGEGRERALLKKQPSFFPIPEGERRGTGRERGCFLLCTTREGAGQGKLLSFAFAPIVYLKQ
jgi:hypothetical protein